MTDPLNSQVLQLLGDLNKGLHEQGKILGDLARDVALSRQALQRAERDLADFAGRLRSTEEKAHKIEGHEVRLNQLTAAQDRLSSEISLLKGGQQESKFVTDGVSTFWKVLFTAVISGAVTFAFVRGFGS